MPNYRGGLGYGNRSFQQVVRSVGGEAMRSDAFGALSRLGQVSGQAAGGGEVAPRLSLPVVADPSGMPSMSSVNAVLPASGSGAGTDPSLLLASLPPELQSQLLGMLMGGGGAGSGAGGSVGGSIGMGLEAEGDLYRALGRRLVEILLNGGLEKLLGVKFSGGGG